MDSRFHRLAGDSFSSTFSPIITVRVAARVGDTNGEPSERRKNLREKKKKGGERMEDREI